MAELISRNIYISIPTPDVHVQVNWGSSSTKVSQAPRLLPISAKFAKDARNQHGTLQVRGSDSTEELTQLSHQSCCQWWVTSLFLVPITTALRTKHSHHLLAQDTQQRWDGRDKQNKRNVGQDPDRQNSAQTCKVLCLSLCCADTESPPGWMS